MEKLHWPMDVFARVCVCVCVCVFCKDHGIAQLSKLCVMFCWLYWV